MGSQNLSWSSTSDIPRTLVEDQREHLNNINEEIEKWATNDAVIAESDGK